MNGPDMGDPDFSVPPFLREDRADLYFLNARTVLEGEGLDPTVTMEVFPSSDGVLCGMAEVLGHLGQALAEGGGGLGPGGGR